MESGIIKKLGNGFGYIIPHGGKAEIFFHVSALEGAVFTELKEGDRVEYRLDDAVTPFQATHVRRLP